MKTKQASTYGILTGNKLGLLPEHINTSEALADYLVRRTMKNDGVTIYDGKFTKQSYRQYLNEWKEEINEREGKMYNDESVILQIADTLVYSVYHIVDMNSRSSISSAEKKAICEAIEEKLLSKI